MKSEEQEYRMEEQDLRILKNILRDEVLATEFASSYDESIFVGAPKLVLKEVINYTKTYKVPPTERVLLERAGSFQDEFSTVLQALQDIEVTPTEFQYDLDKLKNRYAQNKIWSLREVLDQPVAQDELPELVSEILQEMENIQQIQSSTRKTYTQKTLKSYIPEFKYNYSEKIKNPDLTHGILTGYDFLDYAKNGFFSSEMCVIAGATGSGKSMFLSNLAIQMWMQGNSITSKEFTKGHNVLYFSLEMPYEACARRSIARIANVPMYGIRDAKLNEVDLTMLDQAAKFIEKYPHEFEIVDVARGANLAQIEARFLEARKRFNPEVVVVDYLGLMEDNSQPGADDWLKLGNIANSLHEFARYYGIVLLTAVQLNRPKANEESIGMHRIGRSSMILHAADLGIQIETRPNEAKESDLIYHIIKIRDGEMGTGRMVKNFKNASLLNSPWQPESFLQEKFNASSEDLSEYLRQAGWMDR